MAAGVAGAARAGAGAWRRLGAGAVAGGACGCVQGSVCVDGEAFSRPTRGILRARRPSFRSHQTSQGKTRSPKAPVRIPARAGGGAPGEGRRECKLSGQSRPARQRLPGAEGARTHPGPSWGRSPRRGPARLQVIRSKQTSKAKTPGRRRRPNASRPELGAEPPARAGESASYRGAENAFTIAGVPPRGRF